VKPELESVDLTPREQDVLALIVRGFSTKQIADTLGIQFTTVKMHLHNIHSKAGTTTRMRLVVWALNLWRAV
jgi:DNA-binding NarL/FixJ family response regulator